MIPAVADSLGLLRRDLYRGQARYLMPEAQAGNPDDTDSTTFASPLRRTGNGQLRGTVRTTVGGQPLAGALARIVNSAPGMGDDSGAFTLRNVPTGTRWLVVRAVGYYPRRVAVDVIDSAPAVTVTLQAIKSAPDSVRIVAERNRSPNLIGVDKRPASEPFGLFLTQDDIRKRKNRRVWRDRPLDVLVASNRTSTLRQGTHGRNTTHRNRWRWPCRFDHGAHAAHGRCAHAAV